MRQNDTQSKTFHKDIYLPEGMPKGLSFKARELTLSFHARLRLEEKLGLTELPFDEIHGELIEVTMQSGKLEKVVLRCSLNSTQDFVLVVDRGLRVRTLWVNQKSDKHGTLNWSRYVQR